MMLNWSKLASLEVKLAKTVVLLLLIRCLLLLSSLGR